RGSYACCLPSDDCAANRAPTFAKFAERQCRCHSRFFKTLCYFIFVETGHTAYRQSWTHILKLGFARTFLPHSDAALASNIRVSCLIIVKITPSFSAVASSNIEFRPCASAAPRRNANFQADRCSRGMWADAPAVPTGAEARRHRRECLRSRSRRRAGRASLTHRSNSKKMNDG